MQNAKDTFYRMLRDRIARGNAARTVVIRGVQRPAVVVEENELPSAVLEKDTFVLRWTQAEVDPRQDLPLVQMKCAMRYETAGSAAVGGLDRGRSLAGMDAELIAALLSEPQRVVKMAGAPVPVPMDSNVFWSAPVLGPAESVAERMGRTTSVTVYSLEEAGEL